MTATGHFLAFDGTPLGGRVPTKLVADHPDRTAVSADVMASVNAELTKFRDAVRLSAFPTGYHARRAVLPDGSVALFTSINSVESVRLKMAADPGSQEPVLTGIGIRLSNLDDTPIQSGKYSVLDAFGKDWVPRPLVIQPKFERSAVHPDGYVLGGWEIKDVPKFLGGNRVWCSKDMLHWYSVFADKWNMNTYGWVTRLHASPTWFVDRMDPEWVDLTLPKTKTWGDGSPWDTAGGEYYPEEYDFCTVLDSAYVFSKNATYQLHTNTAYEANVFELPPFRCPDLLGRTRVVGVTRYGPDHLALVNLGLQPKLGLERKQVEGYDPLGHEIDGIDPDNPSLVFPEVLAVVEALPNYWAWEFSISVHPDGTQMIHKAYAREQGIHYDILRRTTFADMVTVEEEMVSDFYTPQQNGRETHLNYTEARTYTMAVFDETTTGPSCSGTSDVSYGDFRGMNHSFTAEWTFSSDYGHVQPLQYREHDRTFFTFRGDEVTIIGRSSKVEHDEQAGTYTETLTYKQGVALPEIVIESSTTSSGHRTDETVVEFSTGWEYVEARDHVTYSRTVTQTREAPDTEPTFTAVSVTATYERRATNVLYYDEDWDTMITVEWLLTGSTDLQNYDLDPDDDITPPPQTGDLPKAASSLTEYSQTLKILRAGVQVYVEDLDNEYTAGFEPDNNPEESTVWRSRQRLRDEVTLGVAARKKLNLYGFEAVSDQGAYSITEDLTETDQSGSYSGLTYLPCPGGSVNGSYLTTESVDVEWKDRELSYSVDSTSRDNPQPGYIGVTNQDDGVGDGLGALQDWSTDGRWVCTWVKDPRTRTTLVNVVKTSPYRALDLTGLPDPTKSWLFVIDQAGVRPLSDEPFFSDLPPDAKIWWRYNASSMVAI